MVCSGSGVVGRCGNDGAIVGIMPNAGVVVMRW